MGKNRNRKNNRRNKVNTSDNTRIMKKIMMYQDSEIILGAITDRNVISMAAEDLVAEESEINVFNRIIEGFSVTLDTDEELAVLTALDQVVHNLGDLPKEKCEIPPMVYGDFVDYIGSHAENVHCKKSYDTLASVSEIVESDLDELGWSLSNDTIMTLAIIETLYTAVERASGQVWDECQMSASSSNIPDRETVEQVEMPKSEPEVEKIPEDQVEVITEEHQEKTEEPKTAETLNESKTSDNDEDASSTKETDDVDDVWKTLGLTEEEFMKISTDDIMKLPGIETLVNRKMIMENIAGMSGTTKNLMKEFAKSAIRDLICMVKGEDPTKRIEEKPQRVIENSENPTEIRNVESNDSGKFARPSTPVSTVASSRRKKGPKYDKNTRLEICIKFTNGGNLVFYGSPDEIAETVKEYQMKHSCRVIPEQISTMWGDPISLDYHKTYKFSNGDVETFTGSDYIIDYLVKEYERCNQCKAVDKIA